MSRKIVEDIVNTAKNIFAKEGHLVPVALLSRNGNGIVVNLAFDNQEMKEQSMKMVREMCAVGLMDCVVTVSECWLVEVNRGVTEPMDIELDMPPSMHPDRKETVVIFFEYKNPKPHAGIITIPIIRDGENAFLGEAKWMEDLDGHPEGIMCNLLSKDYN